MPSFLPAPPQTQALSSQTFHPPPLDGSLALPEMFEWHLTHSPRHRLFVYPTETGDVRTIYWEEAVRAMYKGARIIKQVLLRRNSETPPVIALLATSDSITYFTMLVAIMRANCIAFPISPRNSAPAVAHLINKVGVEHVLLGREPAMIDLAKEALDILNAKYSSHSPPSSSSMPIFEDLFDGSHENMDDIPFERKNRDDLLMYLHSSGTTAFPKPIPWTNQQWNQSALCPYFGERDVTDTVWSMHSAPMYHGMGCIHMAWVSSSGNVLSTFEPKSPAIISTPEDHFAAAVKTNCDLVIATPTFIETWARQPECVKWFASRGDRGGLLCGGGPLNTATGNVFTALGVHMISFYGVSEGGIVNTCLPARGIDDWEYIMFGKQIMYEMVNHGNDLYELVLLKSPFYSPSVFNTEIRGIPGYATSDLFAPHASKPGHWKIHGRADDQIMHSTGEKTNPVPLESILNQDPHVLTSVMFGRGYFQTGVIIDPKPEYKFDPDDQAKLAEFRNMIWPTVEKMNAYAPQHSRLFKEMIIVANLSKPFQFTAKNTARRQAAINDYADEIEALYATIEESTQVELAPPSEWDIYSTTDFVRVVVRSVLKNEVGDRDDIFQHGCDSLQATWIRNTLLRVLREDAHLPRREMAVNIYEHPTIADMASYLVDLTSGTLMNEGNPTKTQKKAAMNDFIEKYSQNFPQHKPTSKGASTEGYVVMVTGTTGALGCYLLAALVASGKVSRIYAINRPQKRWHKSLFESQTQSLLDRGLDAATLLGSKKVHSLEANMTLPGFGLSQDVYDNLKDSVTHIIHNAWTVDFNLSLISFEPEIKGLRNLIDFSLTSSSYEPPKFIYCSSIGIFQNYEGPRNDMPEIPVAADIPIGMGYTESKWVSEQILARVAKDTQLKPLTVRVGQLCGGINGCWNKNEWFPAMVHSALVVQCLPREDKEVAWIPLDMAANAFVDFLDGSFRKETIVHLVHPRPISFSVLTRTISSMLSVPTVSFGEWLSRLEELESGDNSGGDIEKLKAVPALRLLPFYRNILPALEQARDAMGFSRLLCSNALALSSTLSNQPSQLDERDAKAWLAYWGQIGFIPSVDDA